MTQKFAKTAPEINVNKRGLKISQISPKIVKKQCFARFQDMYSFSKKLIKIVIHSKF